MRQRKLGPAGVDVVDDARELLEVEAAVVVRVVRHEDLVQLPRPHLRAVDGAAQSCRSVEALGGRHDGEEGG